jgi:hypothetical protein
MSKFMDITVDFISYDAALATKDPADATKIKSIVSESSVTQVYRYQEAVATATTDLVIPLPSATIDYLLIFCDQSVSIKLNSSLTALPLTPQTPATKCFTFFNRGAITSLKLTNASGATVNMDIIAIKK